MSTPRDPVDRVVYWLDDDANRIAALYFLAAGLGLASVLSYIFGDGQGASDVQLGLLFLSAGILFYMAISGMGSGS